MSEVLPLLDDFALGRPVLAWISERFDPGAGVLELGSGRGSAHLAVRYDLRSVEHDQSYLGRHHAVHYIHAPIVHGWYDPDAIAAGIEGFEYQLLIVDGPPGVIGRKRVLDHLDLFELDGVDVIVDDVQRDQELELAYLLAHRLARPCSIEPSDRGRSFAVISGQS